MFRYIISRLGYGILVLFGVATLLFFLFNVLPGDPARMMLGQRADIASVQAINHDLGRDRPIGVQYFSFLNDVSPVSFHTKTDTASAFYFDANRYQSAIPIFSAKTALMVIKTPYLRRSYQSRRPVSDLLAEAFVPTIILASVAMIIASFLGFALGVLSALKKGRWFDKITLIVSTLGMSLPSFFAAILMAWLFAFVLARFTGLNMFGSLYSVDDFGRGEYLDLKNLILPAVTLAMRPLAVITELTRSSMLDTLSQDYIRTAQSKGMGTGRIVMRHAFRNSLIPVVTAISGWFASLMAGAVFIEYIFDWKGVGVVMVDALEKYDFPVVMGAVLFISVLLIIINIFADIAYGLIDPRIRFS